MIVLSRERRLLWLSLLLVATLAGLSWWLKQPRHALPQFNVKAPSRADYYARDAVIHQTDATGKATYRLTSKQVLHFPDHHVTMTQPHLLYLATPTPWDVTADRAVLPSDDGHEVKLFGHVVMQGKLNNGDPFKLTAPRMVVLTKAQRAYTDSPVHMSSATRTADAVGMRAYLATRQVELLKDVRVRYQP